MEDTMKHATRFNTLARQVSGVALGVAHGAVLSVGLMGMAYMATEDDVLTRFSYGDLRAMTERSVTSEAGWLGSGLTVSTLPTVAEMAMLSAAADRAVPSVRAPVASLPTPSLSPRRDGRGALGFAALPELDAVGADPFADEHDTLSSEMVRVRDWISDTYRISGTALMPALTAAEASAQELGFDPLLIVAIMAVESSFNPRAVSNMGAQGLMQVIPRYHQDKIGPNHGKNALFDPVVNVRVGTLVLHEGLQRYGTMQRALQYYNGALKDPNTRYTRKVMALKNRLKVIAGRTSTPSSDAG
jgi:hypothetical protein